jgi:hypothetical protein
VVGPIWLQNTANQPGWVDASKEPATHKRLIHAVQLDIQVANRGGLDKTRHGPLDLRRSDQSDVFDEFRLPLRHVRISTVMHQMNLSNPWPETESHAST